MSSFYSTIYNGLISASVVLFIIGIFTTGKLSVGSYITGYSTLILGIMMLLITMFNKLFSSDTKLPTSQMISTYFIHDRSIYINVRNYIICIVFNDNL